MRPGGNERGANVALRPTTLDAIPRQFGPMSRAPCARTRPSSASCRSTPSSPTSAKPAEMTHSARTPAERLLRGVEHVLARDADDNEVERVRRSRRATGSRARRRPARRCG